LLEASRPFSVTRYSFSLTARSAARLSAHSAALFSLRSVCFPTTLPGSELPTIASFAVVSRWAVRAMSSRQALASLSTRVGRALSLSKVMVQRLWVTGAGGGGGAFSVTVVCDEAVWPLSSTTLQVTVIVVPGAAPVVDNVAVPVFPLMDPAVEL